jgi:hypothetical protein
VNLSSNLAAAATLAMVFMTPTAATASVAEREQLVLRCGAAQYAITTTPHYSAIVLTDDSNMVVVMKGRDGAVFTGVPSSRLTTCQVHDAHDDQFLFTGLFLLTPQN